MKKLGSPGLKASPSALKDTMLPNISPEVVADAAVQVFGGYDPNQFGVSILKFHHILGHWLFFFQDRHLSLTSIKDTSTSTTTTSTISANSTSTTTTSKRTTTTAKTSAQQFIMITGGAYGYNCGNVGKQVSLISLDPGNPVPTCLERLAQLPKNMGWHQGAALGAG